MHLEPVGSSDPRDVLRALRGAVLGAGPAIALGAASGALPTDVPAGTAVVLTTSGSSGHPKSVLLSRSALTASALATTERIGDGAWLLALPATYVAGVQVLVRALVAGHEPAVLSGSFSPTGFAAATHGLASSRGGVPVRRYTSLVPAQLRTLLDAASGEVDAALAAYEAILVGGQALPPALLAAATARGARIVRTYGSTETAGGCVYDGRPLSGVRLRVVGGEVQAAGPTLADGYLDAELTERVFVRDVDGTRWYRTGDAGTLDGDGAEQVLTVTGRLDNVIVSGGVNVSLDRVERAVRNVPGLDAAVVVPIADERWGQASAIVVSGIPGPAQGGALADARAAVADAVGRPARPARLVVVDAVPLLSSGKPDRRAAGRLAADAIGEGAAADA